MSLIIPNKFYHTNLTYSVKPLKSPPIFLLTSLGTLTQKCNKAIEIRQSEFDS